jgi:cell division protein FtsQ
MMTAENVLSESVGIRTATLSGTAAYARVMHGLWLLLMQTMLVCVLIAGVYFSLPWLKLAFDKPIQRVEIHGDFYALDQATIKNIVVIHEQDSFLDIDLSALVNQLESQPWIARARARRQWPDTVAIDIVEQRPIAYWGDKWLVNAKGRLFEHQGLFQNQPLPHLWSESAIPAEAMNFYQIFERQLKPVGLKLRAVSQSLQGDWQLTLDNGLLVMLDRTDPASNVRHFVSIYQQVLLPAQRLAEVVDMRYRRGAAIRWKPPTVPVSEHDGNIERAKHERG